MDEHPPNQTTVAHVRPVATLEHPHLRSGAQLALVTLVAGLAIFSRSAVGPLQEAMRIQLGMSDNQVALLQGPALAAPALIFGLPLGLLVDRRSRIILLMLLSTLSVFGAAVTAVAHSFWELFFARALVGVSSYSIPVAAVSAVSDLYEPGRLGRANMILAVGEIIGMASAFAVGGLLLQATANWRSAMWCLTIPLLLAPLATLIIKEPPRTGVALRRPSPLTSLLELCRYRRLVIPLVCGISLVGVADGAALIWVAPTLLRQLNVLPASVGTIIAGAILIGGILGPLLGGTVADLCQRHGGPACTLYSLSALALASALFGLFGLAHGIVTFGILLFAFLTMGGAINVVIMATLSASIPNDLRGLAVSVCVISGLIFGLGVAPPSVSLVSGALGGMMMIGKALTLVCVTTSAIGTVIFIFGASTAARRGPPSRSSEYLGPSSTQPSPGRCHK